MPNSAVNPQDTQPQPRFKTAGVTARPGAGKTAGITSSSDGKTSFDRKAGFRGKTAQNHSSGTTTDATKTANGKSSFRKV